MYHSFFIYSSVDGHLGCFHVLAIVNSAAMNIVVHVSILFWLSLALFLGFMLPLRLHHPVQEKQVNAILDNYLFSFNYFYFLIYLFFVEIQSLQPSFSFSIYKKKNSLKSLFTIPTFGISHVSLYWLLFLLTLSPIFLFFHMSTNFCFIFDLMNYTV